MLVSSETLEVEGILRDGELYKLHQLAQGTTKEWAKEIAESFLGDLTDHLFVGNVCFHFSGVEGHDDPCWVAYIEPKNPELAPPNLADYIIDPVLKKVVGRIPL